MSMFFPVHQLPISNVDEAAVVLLTGDERVGRGEERDGDIHVVHQQNRLAVSPRPRNSK